MAVLNRVDVHWLSSISVRSYVGPITNVDVFEDRWIYTISDSACIELERNSVKGGAKGFRISWIGKSSITIYKLVIQ